MIQLNMNNTFSNGEIVKIIPINRILKLKDGIDQFKKSHELNSFQKWIVHDFYSLDIPRVKFPIKSIILIAIPHPFYAEVVVTKNRKEYNALSPVMSDFDKAEKVLRRLLSTQKNHIAAAKKLPLKRLAVQSGLAVYGRNNVCYIEGLGSNFSFAAYFSDVPCNDEYWTDVTLAARCTTCTACLKNCPTGAIQKNNFLIDNERCLSYWNESAEPFPEWMPKSAHHCLYDCIRCQAICPMNKDQIKEVVGPIQFTESETNMLLSGLAYEKQPRSLKQKVKYLGLHQWPDGIAKNIETLIELIDSS